MKLNDYFITCLPAGRYLNFYYRLKFIGLMDDDSCRYLHVEVERQLNNHDSLIELWKEIMKRWTTTNPIPYTHHVELLSYLKEYKPIMYK